MNLWRWGDSLLGEQSSLGSQMQRLANAAPPDGQAHVGCGAGPDMSKERVRLAGGIVACLRGHPVAPDGWERRSTWRTSKVIECPDCTSDEVGPHTCNRCGAPMLERKGLKGSSRCSGGHVVTAYNQLVTCERGHIRPRKEWWVRHEIFPTVHNDSHNASALQAAERWCKNREQTKYEATLARTNRLDDYSRRVLFMVYGPNGFPNCCGTNRKDRPDYDAIGDRFPWKSMHELAPIAKLTPEVRAVALLESVERRTRAIQSVRSFWENEPDRLKALYDAAMKHNKIVEAMAYHNLLCDVARKATIANHPSQFPYPPLDLERALTVVLQSPQCCERMLEEAKQIMRAACDAWEKSK